MSKTMSIYCSVSRSFYLSKVTIILITSIVLARPISIAPEAIVRPNRTSNESSTKYELSAAIIYLQFAIFVFRILQLGPHAIKSAKARFVESSATQSKTVHKTVASRLLAHYKLQFVNNVCTIHRLYYYYLFRKSYPEF